MDMDETNKQNPAGFYNYRLCTTVYAVYARSWAEDPESGVEYCILDVEFPGIGRTEISTTVEGEGQYFIQVGLFDKNNAMACKPLSYFSDTVDLKEAYTKLLSEASEIITRK